MLEKRRQNLAETDRGSYYNQEEWLEEFLEDKGAFCNGFESDDIDNDDENYNEIIGAVVCRCSSKWVFLKILQIPQENTWSFFLIKFQSITPATLFKTGSNTVAFP